MLAIDSFDMSAASQVWEPLAVEEAWELYKTFGAANSKYVSGGTLLRTQWESGSADIPRHLISLAAIEELKGIECIGQKISIGSMTTLSECCKNRDVIQSLPLLLRSVQSIAAPSVRNMATLGGNIRSIVGDSIPALLVYDAELVWYDGAGPVVERLEDWLVYGGADSEERILLKVWIPVGKVDANQIFFYEKVGRREAFTPSVVTIAVQGGRSGFRIVAGGGTARAMRLTKAESLLNGNAFSLALFQEVHQAVMEEFETYSDPFASARYRSTTAANVIVAGLWKAFGKGEAACK
jgi:xanthine dehydrogenase C subunit